MSFAKFCSLLDRKALFFSLVGDMEDRYEGFIYRRYPANTEIVCSKRSASVTTCCAISRVPP